MGREAAMVYVPGPDAVLIAIRTPNNGEWSIPRGYTASLSLAFVDADNEPDMLPPGVTTWLTPALAASRGQKVFRTGDAERIVEFLVRNQGMRRLVIHCDAGGSRSPGVALGLSDAWWPGAVDEAAFPNHNRYVRAIVRRVAFQHHPTRYRKP